jgi:hypothetical protein
MSIGPDDIVEALLGADLSSELEKIASESKEALPDSESEKLAEEVEDLAMSLEDVEAVEQEKTASCARIDDLLETVAAAHGLQ